MSIFLPLQETFLATPIASLKPRPAHCLPLRATVLDAVRLFNTAHVGSVLILDDEGALRGIFTERDLITKFRIGRPLLDRHLSEVMSSPVERTRATSSIARALHLCSSAGFRHLVIFEKDRTILRALSARDLIDFIYNCLIGKCVPPARVRPADQGALKEFFRKPLNTLAHRRLATIDQNARVAEAIHRMRTESVGALGLTSAEGVLCGIFSERDLALKVFVQERDPAEVIVHEVATPEPVTLAPEDTVAELFKRISLGGFRHIPILDGSTAIKVVSLRDTIRMLGRSI